MQLNGRRFSSNPFMFVFFFFFCLSIPILQLPPLVLLGWVLHGIEGHLELIEEPLCTRTKRDLEGLGDGWEFGEEEGLGCPYLLHRLVLLDGILLLHVVHGEAQ